MHSIRSAVAVAAVVALTFVGAGSAAAAPPDGLSEREVVALEARVRTAPDPAAAFDRLAPAEQEAILDAAVLVTEGSRVGPAQEVAPTDPAAHQDMVRLAKATGTTVESLQAATATKCWTRKGWQYGWNYFGNKLWTAWHVGGWCASGRTVTSARVAEAGGQTHWLGWSYAGVVARWSGVVSNEGRSSSQTSFQFGWQGIFQHRYPCLRVRGLSTGSAYHSNSCGIY